MTDGPSPTRRLAELLRPKVSDETREQIAALRDREAEQTSDPISVMAEAVRAAIAEQFANGMTVAHLVETPHPAVAVMRRAIQALPEGWSLTLTPADPDAAPVAEVTVAPEPDAP